ncbi:sugar ABC transporter ATP-binding protein [soil metagenome]
MTKAPIGEPVVKIDGLTRSFSGTVAVDDVSFSVNPGEIHGLCGHNGAGKSTLIRMLAGQLSPDSGSIVINGQPVRLRSPQSAQRAGIAVVDQELSVIPALTVEENLRLGDVTTGLFRGSAGRADRRSLLDDLGLGTVRLDARVSTLGLGQRQLVEIARGLGRNARLLILDEPTATLSETEAQLVFAAIRKVAERGCAVLFVSHRLREVLDLCDRVTVLRDAKFVATTDTADLTTQQLIVQMLGEAPHRPARPATETGGRTPSLTVSDLTVPGAVSGFSLEAAAGTVYGIAGQLGSGASDVLRALAGLQPAVSGTVSLGGTKLVARGPVARHRAGIMFISNDRKAEGLFLESSVGVNLTATRLPALSRFGIVDKRRERAERRRLAELAGVDTARMPDPIAGLSGGNQQKVFTARALGRADARVLLIDEPTRGVDIGGRAAIHELLRSAAAEGLVVIFASTELEELIELADVIITMKDGHQVRRHDGDIRGTELMADMTHDGDGAA